MKIHGLERVFNRNITIAIIALLMVYFIYWVFYVPYNRTKKMHDVGYDLKIASKPKRDETYQLKRLRKINAKELPPPYPNGWYGIAESCNIKRGQVLSVFCLGQQFVLFRTRSNKVYVLDAYCPHLGANMGFGGRVVGENIECPFHRWTFRGSDGQCTSIPYSSTVPNLIHVRKWISQEVNDFIFIWYHMDNCKDPWEIPRVTELENREIIFHGRNEFYVNCHIQEIPENGSDLAHFSAVHSANLFAGVNDTKRYCLSNFGYHHWDAIWQPLEEDKRHFASINLTHSVELVPKYRIFQFNVTGEQIGPSYVQMQVKSHQFGQIDILQSVVPVEPLVQKVVHRFYSRRTLAPIVKFLVFGESLMFERDVYIWNHKIFQSKPRFVKEDATIKTFRKWYSQFYSSNSKSYDEAKDDLNW